MRTILSLVLIIIEKILWWGAILGVANAAVCFAVVHHEYATSLLYAVIAVFLLLDRKGRKKQETSSWRDRQ